MARPIVEPLSQGEANSNPSNRSLAQSFGSPDAKLSFGLNECCDRYNPDPRILIVLEYIDRTKLSAVSIELAAALVHLSPSRLRSLFKQSTAMSFHQYVRFSRLQRARALLLEGSLQVKEIAARIGVSEMSHFIRDYRFVYGDSPTKHRRLNCPNVAARA